MAILQNEIECLGCGDRIFSAHRHDFRTCKCGATSVDGGMAYLKRVFDREVGFIDHSIEIPDAAKEAAIEGIKWAHETGRNELGILCAVVRALRDNGVKIESEKEQTS